MGTRGYGPFSTETPITFVKKLILHLGTIFEKLEIKSVSQVKICSNNFFYKRIKRNKDCGAGNVNFTYFYVNAIFIPPVGLSNSMGVHGPLATALINFTTYSIS